MTNRRGITAGGNWIVDKLKFIDTYPQQDALANIRSETIGNGGGPFNVLIDLARLEAPFPLAGVGLVGNDADGAWVLEQCDAHRIDAAQIKTHPAAHTSYTDVMTVQGTGRRTFFHQRGANAFLAPEHFGFSGSNARIFHLAYLLLLDRLDEADAEFGTSAARVLHAARQTGHKTSVDVVSEDSRRFAQIVLPALRHVDYCFLNEFELERTTNIPTRTGESIDLSGIEAACGRLLEAGVGEWVIVHFPEGACALGRDGTLHVQGSVCLPQESIVGSVGAGDAFAAGVLHGLHEESGIGEALKDGVVAAAACLTGGCASDGMRPLQECRNLAAQFGFRKLT